jgi:uncharacterized protein YkwD
MRAWTRAVVGVMVQGVLLFMAGSALASAACPSDERIPTAASAADAARALVCDINVIRGRHDLAPVRWNDTVAQPAQSFAEELAVRHEISHTSTDGRAPKDRVFATGYFDGFAAWLVLENVEWGSSVYATPLATAVGWMQSTEHRANLLDPQAQEIGVGVAQGELADHPGSGTFYVADFAARGDTIKSARTTRKRRTCTARKRHDLRRKRCRRRL